MELGNGYRSSCDVLESRFFVIAGYFDFLFACDIKVSVRVSIQVQSESGRPKRLTYGYLKIYDDFFEITCIV